MFSSRTLVKNIYLFQDNVGHNVIEEVPQKLESSNQNSRRFIVPSIRDLEVCVPSQKDDTEKIEQIQPESNEKIPTHTEENEENCFKKEKKKDDPIIRKPKISPSQISIYAPLPDDPSPTGAKNSLFYSNLNHEKIPENSLSKNAKNTLARHGAEYPVPDPQFDFSKLKVLQAEEGATYIGELAKGDKAGYGRVISPDGSVYEGFWYRGAKHGKGRQIKKSGKLYCGEYSFGKKEGYGVQCENNGCYYKGMWKGGKKKGKGEGKVILSDYSTYVGDLENGKIHGVGVLKFTDGRVYEGEFYKEIPQGKGISFFFVI